MTDFDIRAARAGDCADLAILVNIASRGLALWLWQGAVNMGKADDTHEWGRRRLLDTEKSPWWRNATVAEKDGQILGAAIHYEKVPSDVVGGVSELVPLTELHTYAAHQWYLDSLSVYPESRKMGIGDALIDSVKATARSKGFNELTLTAEDANIGALRLYDKHGFVEKARRPFIEFNGNSNTKNWLLLSAPLT